jgi:low affinity Fe/Cu permease
MPSHNSSFFTRFAKRIAAIAGRPLTFAAAVGVLIVWAATGPVFGFNDTWQLVINTGTTIVTFLMVFLLQNTQNRDSEALQIKLDELIRSVKAARNEMMDLEDLDEEELDKIKEQYMSFARKAEEMKSQVEKEEE